MLVRVLSDLHLEFYRDDGRAFLQGMKRPLADVLVLAGDIGKSKGTTSLRALFRYFKTLHREVLYVPGNHEFYDDSFNGLRDLREACAEHKVTLLEPGVTQTINGTRFIGATMWFPRKIGEPGTPAVGESAVNDFFLIRGFVPDVYEHNKLHVEWLRSEIKPGDVVVTHHMPSHRSVHEKYKDDPLNKYFVCDMEDVIMKQKPTAWIHGHTHYSFDYHVGETRIVCNPAGYPLSDGTLENKSFDSSKTFGV